MNRFFDALAVLVLILAMIVNVIGWFLMKYQGAVGIKIFKKELRQAKFPLSYRQIALIWGIAGAVMFCALFYLMKQGYLHP